MSELIWPIWQPKWSRVIGFVDFDAFFASVEQWDNPALRHKPIAVTNGEKGSCIITCSYEARASGIQTGMRYSEAKRLCPSLQRCPSRPQRYAQLSSMIMHALKKRISPDIEVFSIDEAFIDLTHIHHLYPQPIELLNTICQTIEEVIKLPFSLAIGGNKTCAKYFAQATKPHGRCIVPPWYNQAILKRVPTQDLCGIGQKTALFLARHGVYTCGDIDKIPISVLAKRFGALGRRIWYMCQGRDPQPVDIRFRHAKSMGHSKVLPPGSQAGPISLRYLQDLCYRLAQRMRQNSIKARLYRLSYQHASQGWFVIPIDMITAHADGQQLYRLCRDQFNLTCPKGHIGQISIVAYELIYQVQGDLFDQPESSTDLQDMMDRINSRYGPKTLQPLSLQNHRPTRVISPAWKPSGTRQTIEGVDPLSCS